MSTMFSAFTLREVTFRNRISISPMSQYSARDGHANDWHMVHLVRFAMDSAGLVYAETTAVERDSRCTHGDLGLWKGGQIEELKGITAFLGREVAVPGIQLSHVGRKAPERRPWHGETPAD